MVIVSSLLGRPLKSALVWTTSGMGMAWALPSVLSQAGIISIYSTTLISTTLYGGAFAILLPLGLARGIVSSAQQQVLVWEQQQQQLSKDPSSIDSAVPQMARQMESGDQDNNNNNNKWLLESITRGSGWQGQVFRTLVSPFWPSTAQMLVRVQQVVDNSQSNPPSSTSSSSLNTRHNNDVLTAAATGLVEGFLQDKQDTITMVGSLAYLSLLGVAFALDYSYRKADETRLQFQQRVRATQEAWNKSTKVEDSSSKKESSTIHTHHKAVVEEHGARILQPKRPDDETTSANYYERAKEQVADLITRRMMEARPPLPPTKKEDGKEPTRAVVPETVETANERTKDLQTNMLKKNVQETLDMVRNKAKELQEKRVRPDGAIPKTSSRETIGDYYQRAKDQVADLVQRRTMEARPPLPPTKKEDGKEPARAVVPETVETTNGRTKELQANMLKTVQETLDMARNKAKELQEKRVLPDDAFPKTSRDNAGAVKKKLNAWLGWTRKDDSDKKDSHDEKK